MKIKRLQLTGFKSCMDRTVLEFPRGITGVVGPNGCGKSNIVDALRWVLGEQSAKHLRGQVMEDVIFAGNERFGPLGVAEVTITFDNDGSLEHLDLDSSEDEPEITRALKHVPEIEVTRRLYRSGESEYFINGRTCRLRDITELFLGTGVGTKAYSIIEQGRVGQIVGAKPEELRLFIEEAAGTTLYRSRKLAAERKIERTRNNLLRVSDIVQELERQAASLRRQARGAVRYKELKQSEQELDARLTAHRLRSILARAEGIRKELQQAVESEADLKRCMEELSSRRDDLRTRRAELGRDAEHAQRIFYESKGRVAELEQERRFLETRVLELDEACEQAGAELAELETRFVASSREEDEALSARHACADDLEKLESELGVAEAAAMELESRSFALGAELEETKSALVDALARRASLSNERSALERNRGELMTRRQRLVDEEQSLATLIRRLEDDVIAAQVTVSEIDSELEEASVGKEAAARELRAALAAKALHDEQLDAARAQAAGLDSRLRSLEELNEGFVGYGEGVRAFMSNGGVERTGAFGVVADLLDIDAGYERAVAAVLQERLQYVIVPDADAGIEGATYLKETGHGRASFMPMHPRRAASTVPMVMPSGLAALADHVRAKDGYAETLEQLISGVVVAESLAQATAEWRRNGASLTYVTREGEVLDAAGVVTGGSGRPLDEGILARRTELRGLERELAQARAAVEGARLELTRFAADADRLSEHVGGLDKRLHELTVDRVGAQGELELQRQNLARTSERREAVHAEVGAHLREIEQIGKKEAELADELDSVSSEIRQRERLLEEGSAARSRLEEERRAASARLESMRVREAETRQKRESCEMRLVSVRQLHADLASRRTSVSGRIERDRGDADAARERLAGPDLSIDRVRETLTKAQADHERAQAESETAERDLAEVQTRLDEMVAEAEVVRDRRGRLDFKLKECELERQSIKDAARERMGEEAAGALDDAVAEVQEDANQLAEELERVRNGLRRLGVVNVAAVDELEELQARLDELTAQRDDLERSIEDLRGTIARLNRVSRQRFKHTFESVNEIFQKTFPKLFRGGRAWLTLTDESNLLETGVEIFVQPPGKKLGNLNLLSGGEKALTAVSLIFSLFLHKPSPFCVLDEVDAPLDDANIGRFAGMVADMSERSQFVLITHNKRTMECCNMLYGVTMREPGISKIVSVEMSRAVEVRNEEGARASAPSEQEPASAPTPS